MGYDFATMDNIYPKVRPYWKSRLPRQHFYLLDPYFANHTQAFAFLNATRDATPACNSAQWS